MAGKARSLEVGGLSKLEFRRLALVVGTGGLKSEERCMPRAGRREALPLYVGWDRFRVILGVNASHTILSHQL